MEIQKTSNPLDPSAYLEKILSERGANYGKFSDQAYLSQKLKAAVWNHENFPKLQPIQAEAIEMILHKIARIINGDPDYIDSWTDIAGYSSLVEKHLKGKGI